ncbi:protein of unknown function [Sphaerochaeta associata]|uniref:DUF4386 family protein n=1 Tax=Sphaerochaeta associata TaxID=1129264 RepID=A0ABY4DC60_9SPIR|nr:DUF4386 family protein [Sphaerochaeta associata]UOM51629.1 DUF4386 family protein [Sphaerochaeta associata]SMP52593.1 protein of unknown function [Sphaerochaeta associata]
MENSPRLLGKTAAFCSLAMLVLIPTQIIVFSLHRPPSEAKLWFDLFASNWFLGLIEMDLLYLIDNALVALVYLGLYEILKEKHRALMQIALLLGYIGIAAYYSSNPAFELWEAQRNYAQASTLIEQQTWLTIAESLILQWRGTAFNSYYILNGICLILISYALIKSDLPREIGVIGLISGILMSIPSTAGMIGLVFSILSLIPWMFFLALLYKPLKNML